MVATQIGILQHNLEAERKHLLERLKAEVDSEESTSAWGVFLLEQRLLRVSHTLGKIEEETYGLCDACGQPIEPERLEALPEANLCYRCKTRQANRR